MFDISKKIKSESLEEQEQAPSLMQIWKDSISLDKGLLSNIFFVMVLVMLISSNIFIRDKTGQYRAQSELINKDIRELRIQNDASLYRIENANKKEHVMSVLQQHHLDLHEGTTPNRRLVIKE